MGKTRKREESRGITLPGERNKYMVEERQKEKKIGRSDFTLGLFSDGRRYETPSSKRAPTAGYQSTVLLGHGS